MRSIVTSPFKGVYQVGSTVIAMVRGLNVVELKMANKDVPIQMYGKKPYTKDDFR